MKGEGVLPKSMLMALTWREPGTDGQGPFSPLPQDTEYCRLIVLNPR